MRRDDGLIKKAYIWLPLIALAILPLILSIWSSLGTWEGRLFPVVEQTTLKTWERVPGGFTAQWHYYKGRSCRPVAIAFYAGERESGSGFSKIPIQRISIRDEPDQLVANSPANPLGWQDSSIYKLWTDTPPISIPMYRLFNILAMYGVRPSPQQGSMIKSPGLVVPFISRAI